MRKILIIMVMLGISLLLVGSVFALESLEGQTQEQTQTFTQTVTVTVLPGGMNVYSPIQANIYNERMIPINLSMSYEAKYLRYSDNDGDPITICRNCNEYGFSSVKRKPFDDGFHKLRLITVFKSGTVYTERDFFVDTKMPKITKTEPEKNSADGIFAVEFQEANPVSVVLDYGNLETGMRNAFVNLESCYEVRRNIERCYAYTDLTDYNSQEISYKFSLIDILGNKDESKVKNLDVCIFPCDSSYFPI
jgi:hypothetical protein